MLNRLVPELTYRMVEKILPLTSRIGRPCCERCGKLAMSSGNRLKSFAA